MSADSNSTEKPAGAEDGASEETVDSRDQSLLAIMKEVQEADEQAPPEATATAAPQTDEIGAVTPTAAASPEVPLPEPEPAIQRPETLEAMAQTAEGAAWQTEPSAEPGRHAAEESSAIADALAASAAGDERAASETSDDAEVELSDAAVELTVEELEAEAVVESILATARTSHHDAEQTLGAAPALEENAP